MKTVYSNTKLVINQNVVIEIFKYPVLALVDYLKRGKLPSKVKPRETYILFKKKADLLDMFEIDKNTKDLLDTVKNGKSVLEIYKKFQDTNLVNAAIDKLSVYDILEKSYIEKG